MILKLFDVAHSTRVSSLSFRWPRPKHPVALSDVFVCPPTLALKSPNTIMCNVFAFPGSYQCCCISCRSLHLNEMSLAHILERSIFSWYLSVMRRTSSATMEFPDDTLIMLSFHFLFTRKPTPACPLLASEWYSRWPLWRVVKLSSFLRTSPSPIMSHFMLFSFTSSSSSCTCSSLVMCYTLYFANFSRSPLVWKFFLTQRFSARPVCSLGGPEPLPRSHTSMLLGAGDCHEFRIYIYSL